MNIPYDVDPRPSTGLTNARLGMMLFLASGVMLFGALMTSYVFLRVSDAGWTGGAGVIDGRLTLVNTALMAVASLAMLMARSAQRRGATSRAAVRIAGALVAGIGFAVTTVWGYDEALGRGLLPSTNTFAAIWYVVTGLHALHVAGGLVVLLLLLGPWGPSRGTVPGKFGVRVDVAGLYWHFLTVTWMVTAATFSLS